MVLAVAAVKPLPILLLVLLALALLFLVFFIISGVYFYNLAVKVNNKSDLFTGNTDLEAVKMGTQSKRSVQMNTWVNGASFEKVSVTAFDGLRLAGLYKENETFPHKWVIIVHGYTSCASDMKSFAYQYYINGYHILMPDCRGHGDSEGDYIGMGWHDRLDMLKWIDFIIERYTDAQIVLHGVSMGGATVMMTAGEKLPANVKCVVEDCGYTSVYDEFAYQLDRMFNLPRFPFMTAASLVCRVKARYGLQKASALEQVKKSETPMMFVHGDEDTFVPFHMVFPLYEAASCEKLLYIAHGASHGGASQTDPDMYWKQVFQFIDQYID